MWTSFWGTVHWRYQYSVAIQPMRLFHGIIILVSTSSLSLHNDKRRFPTTVPWFSAGFDNIIWTLFDLVQVYNWKKFSLVCDDNRKDPIFFIFDIFCQTVQQSFRLKAMRSRDINMLVVKFDSSVKNSIQSMLEKCLAYSSSSYKTRPRSTRQINLTVVSPFAKRFP